jgi:hypothetical protein
MEQDTRKIRKSATIGADEPRALPRTARLVKGNARISAFGHRLPLVPVW